MSDQVQTAALAEQSAPPPSNDGIAIPGEAPVSSVESSETQSDDRESRARAMGWVPREEFRGPPENWRDADEFIRRGEEEMPILRERNRDLARKVSELERTTQEFNQRVASLDRMNQLALQRQRDQLIGQYEAAIRDAVRMGDEQRYDQLTRDRGQALHNFDTHVQEVAQPKPQPVKFDENGFVALPQTEAQARQEWLRSNPWFTADPELNQVAQHAHMRLLKEKPNLSLAENLAETTKYVRQRYADRFGSTAAPAVEGGGGRIPSAAASRKRTVSDIPASDRAIGERHVREGLYKDINEWAQDYFNQ